MLKIDLLPRHFAIARKNKALLAMFVVLLAATGLAWFWQGMQIAGQINAVAANEAALQSDLSQVDSYTSKTSAKQADLKPIKDKVDFADTADKSGRGYWKAYHAINEYIWEGAQVTDFSISCAGKVDFTVTV